MNGQRREENAPGKYYVTHECNGCGVCFSIAPRVVSSSGDGLYFYVIRQPVEERDEHTLLEAMALCQMDCIRDDGDRM